MNFKNISIYTLAALTLVGCGNSPAEKLAQEDKNTRKAAENANNSNLDINKVSQALGNFIGRNLNSPGIHFDLENVIKGIREGAAGKPSPMDEKEYEQAMAQLQQQATIAVSSKNLEAAEKYMKDNANAKGVVEIIPGKLQYIILNEGQDPAVVEHGTPQITYVGKYIDGTVFGDSSAAGGPITVPLDQTIPGFSKGIEGMKEGEKRRLFVHPDVGYGTGGQLLPNSLLIFDIEVIKATSSDKNHAEQGDDGYDDQGTYGQ
ncbi:MAG TPA: FKBP-type peptidyl-prolyl cis-trans isomerase [Parachlamydiaceae bacterium]|nr:FKBP-type peptidyl-prolyl cis-trans isomerase [Parachlamydiaceae bacterium]